MQSSLGLEATDSGVVSEGVNSSGVGGTQRCSGREDGDGG